ncbi:hypothetical protein HK100_012614 [Physocladia obscura]|uniref:Uncharacterized protein n=1 Tax=Physocladia obscura TaxID=109957 RepID=A0AAD5T235_9FUNG|nr:hypothetical protein HK100_012614 [Physocladia obscura]
MMDGGKLAEPIEKGVQIYKLPLLESDESTQHQDQHQQTRRPTWAKGSNAHFNFTVFAYVTPDLEAAAVDEARRIADDHAHGHPGAKNHSHETPDPATVRKEALKQKAFQLESMVNQLKLGAKQPSQRVPSKQSSTALSATTLGNNLAEKPSNSDNNSSTNLGPAALAASAPIRKRISSTRETNAPGTPYFELRIGLGFSVPALEKCVKTMLPGTRARFLCLGPETTDGYAQLESILRQEKTNRDLIAQGKPPIRTSGCCASSVMASAASNSGSPANMELQQNALALQRDLLLLNTCAALEFEIELANVVEPGDFMKEPWEMTAAEKYAEAPVRKSEGGELYKRGDYAGACEKYTRALVLLESLSTSPAVTDMQRQIGKDRDAVDREVSRRVAERRRLERIGGREIPPEFTREAVDIFIKESEGHIARMDFADNSGVNPNVVISLMQTCRLNYAACKLKLGDFSAVIVQCSEVVKNDKNNIKALFRRAQAYRKIGRDLDLARKDLNTLRDLFLSRETSEDSSEYVELQREEQELENKFHAANQKEQQMYKNLFK